MQFSDTTEQEYRHVDADRLAAVDGLALDERTPTQDAATVDVEDCTVMFAINRLRSGRDSTAKGRLRTFDHIVLDEAQELAPLELAVIGRALDAGGSITVAGDDHQQTDESAAFGGWSEAMRALGAAHYHRAVLEESYRCPPAVLDFARALFERDVCPPPPARSPRRGSPAPAIDRCASSRSCRR